MKQKIELSKERKFLVIGIILSLLLILFGIISGDVGVLGNTIILSIFLFIILPQSIFTYTKYRDLREMELRFPGFLRDLVESTKAGIPLHKAIILASKTDYGPLSKEISKMAYQLSWNVNILKVLEQSRERLRKSDLLNKNMRILIETYRSGGSIDDTLDALSSTLMTIQETQKERKSTLDQYVVAMYVITFIFIGIVVGINKLMVPIFTAVAGGEGPVGNFLSNPCDICLYGGDISCSPCYIYFSICSFFHVDKAQISCYYLALFFSMSVIQAITGGLVAGQIGEGSVTAGIKHSLIMLIVDSGIFFIFVRLGLLGG
jgi:flagellar protein FlaJ